MDVEQHRDLCESGECVLVRLPETGRFTIFDTQHRAVVLIDEDDELADAVVQRMIEEGVRIHDDIPE